MGGFGCAYAVKCTTFSRDVNAAEKSPVSKIRRVAFAHPPLRGRVAGLQHAAVWNKQIRREGNGL